jgi:integrase/recombinase XerD
MSIEQLPLFPGDEGWRLSDATGEHSPGLTARVTLGRTMQHFSEHMKQQDYAENTIKSFLGDLRILRRYLEDNPPIGEISTKRLKGFLHWLQHERGKPCSPKSYARRLTTLKVFFGWLAEAGVLPRDPAAPLVHKPAEAPLPRILYDHQVEEVLAVTRQMMAGEHPDPRPHLLVTLILHTGIKKQECMGIRLAHIDVSASGGPVIHIRYDNPRMQYKERRLRLPPNWTRTLDRYRDAYEPQDNLFPCTARNLEYVLAGVAEAADLPNGLSFEMLRWTCAVRDFVDGMDPDRLRRKLGLSRMSWKETEPKLAKLTEEPL